MKSLKASRNAALEFTNAAVLMSSSSTGGNSKNDQMQIGSVEQGVRSKQTVGVVQNLGLVIVKHPIMRKTYGWLLAASDMLQLWWQMPRGERLLVHVAKERVIHSLAKCAQKRRRHGKRP